MRNLLKLFKNISSASYVVLVAIFINVIANATMYGNLYLWLQESNTSYFYGISLFIFQLLLLIFIFSIATMHGLYKYVLSIFLLISAFSAYFIDTYGVIIDHNMLTNALETNSKEVMGLISWEMLLYLIIIFFAPSFLMFKTRSKKQSYFKRLKSHLLLALSSLLMAILIVVSLSGFYASFFREHKELRVYSNPLSSVYATYKLLKKNYFEGSFPYKKIGLDVSIQENQGPQNLTIMVVGETARSDHFSLNGYNKPTNPLLSEQKNIVSFSNFSACGTSTAISVPCMFSLDDRENFSQNKAENQDNVLDILSRAGVEVIWRDNNSSSKGVANRIKYENFRVSDLNPVCDVECRDIGMLDGLDQYIKQRPNKDILIVLHQMGSHGPDYYKRYPDEFKKFKPICETNQLNDCSQEEIINVYDNTILYTDYFLDNVIGFLKKYDTEYKTAMLYISDHGESLGEGNIYLHGLPYMFAPDSQTKVPGIIWLGSGYSDISIEKFQRNNNIPLSHDYVFHSLLGLFKANTKIYQKDKDIFRMGD